MKNLTRTDFIIIGVLFALLVGWGPLYTAVIAPRLAPPKPAVAPATPSPWGATNTVTALSPGVSTELRPAPAQPATPAQPAASAVMPAVAPAEEAVPAAPAAADPALAAARRDPANLVVLSNSLIRVGISRIGGGIAFAELLKFPETTHSSKPLVLDFATEPALSIVNPDPRAAGAAALDALTAGRTFAIEAGKDGRSVKITAEAPGGLHLERTLTLGDDYRLTLADRFVNTGPAALALPEYTIQAGPLVFLPTKGDVKQGLYLGIDTLATSAGADVQHWGSGSFFGKSEKLTDFFQPPERRGGGCSMNKPVLVKPLPVTVVHPVRDRADWLAVKNKFFAQILMPEGGSAGFVLGGSRLVPPGERAEDPRTWTPAPLITGVSAGMTLDPVAVEAGQTVERKLSYYVGPKEYSRIEPMGNRIVEVMEFGKLRPICWLLLVCLKWLHMVIPNYGVAIILLTILIRLVFWPITQKSTDSMRKMQEVQPKIAALREKFKDKPQKIQEETMKLYKEHKVNPLGGCLPMLIQIPVFIALFNVLRSAVELRYAGFLWVSDLSEPEGLFAGMIPFISSLNILPIIMTATSVWQTFLTPSGGDPTQQKMMLLMPIMMLFIFYSMPAALVLYWTANQVLMIVQLLWQKRKQPVTA